jgi:hypothetical protein
MHTIAEHQTERKNAYLMCVSIVCKKVRIIQRFFCVKQITRSSLPLGRFFTRYTRMTRDYPSSFLSLSRPFTIGFSWGCQEKNRFPRPLILISS